MWTWRPDHSSLLSALVVCAGRAHAGRDDSGLALRPHASVAILRWPRVRLEDGWPASTCAIPPRSSRSPTQQPTPTPVMYFAASANQRQRAALRTGMFAHVWFVGDLDHAGRGLVAPAGGGPPISVRRRAALFSPTSTPGEARPIRRVDRPPFSACRSATTARSTAACGHRALRHDPAAAKTDRPGSARTARNERDAKQRAAAAASGQALTGAAPTARSTPERRRLTSDVRRRGRLAPAPILPDTATHRPLRRQRSVPVRPRRRRGAAVGRWAGLRRGRTGPGGRRARPGRSAVHVVGVPRRVQIGLAAAQVRAGRSPSRACHDAQHVAAELARRDVEHDQLRHLLEPLRTPRRRTRRTRARPARRGPG